MSTSSSKCPVDFPSASSSAGKRAKILLRNTLSSNMDWMKRTRKWQISTDDSLWRDILSDVLVGLTLELASTNMKGSVEILTLKRADEIMKSFNEDELEAWKVGVRNGVKKNDWTDLLARRTSHISGYQII